MKLQNTIAGVFVAFGIGIASPVGAATFTCGADVQFTLNVSSGSIVDCVTGNGTLNNLPSPYDAYLFLDSDPETTVPSPQEGWFTISTSTFTIDSTAWTGFGNMALVLQLPRPSPKPDWAVFILGSAVLGGSWSNSGAETFELASLYRGTPLPSTPVSEPASLLLLGSGLFGFAWAVKARKRLI